MRRICKSRLHGTHQLRATLRSLILIQTTKHQMKWVRKQTNTKKKNKKKMFFSLERIKRKIRKEFFFLSFCLKQNESRNYHKKIYVLRREMRNRNGKKTHIKNHFHWESYLVNVPLFADRLVHSSSLVIDEYLLMLIPYAYGVLFVCVCV